MQLFFSPPISCSFQAVLHLKSGKIISLQLGSLGYEVFKKKNESG